MLGSVEHDKFHNLGSYPLPLGHGSLMSLETYLARSSGLGASASWASSLATSSSDLKMTGIMPEEEFPLLVYVSLIHSTYTNF